MATKVFICSPLRGDIEGNLKKVRVYCRYWAMMGFRPFAPHLYYTQFLEEMSESERMLGIKLGLEDLKDCKILLAFAPNYEECSEGMKMEIDLANKLKIRVVYCNPDVEPYLRVLESD